MLHFYDFEVFSNDWLVVIINPVEKTKQVIVNNSDEFSDETSNNQTPGGTTWEAQLRYWNAESEGGKTENNLTDYRANGLMIGHTANIPPTPCYLSIFLDFLISSMACCLSASFHMSDKVCSGLTQLVSSVTAAL